MISVQSQTKTAINKAQQNLAALKSSKSMAHFSQDVNKSQLVTPKKKMIDQVDDKASANLMRLNNSVAFFRQAEE